MSVIAKNNGPEEKSKIASQCNFYHSLSNTPQAYNKTKSMFDQQHLPNQNFVAIGSTNGFYKLKQNNMFVPRYHMHNSFQQNQHQSRL